LASESFGVLERGGGFGPIGRIMLEAKAHRAINADASVVPTSPTSSIRRNMTGLSLRVAATNTAGNTMATISGRGRRMPTADRIYGLTATATAMSSTELK
jgi:hypothetical protein